METTPMNLRRAAAAAALLALLLAPFVPAAIGAEEECGQTGPAPDAASLWKYITEQDPYRQWQPFPGQRGNVVRLTEKPHGDWVGVFLNDVAVRSLDSTARPFTMEYGSILVKENYPAALTPPPPTELLTITVMYKVKGFRFSPGQEEWFWVMFTPEGEVVTVSDQPFAQGAPFESFRGEVQAGKPWLCLSCHVGAAERGAKAAGDYVWLINPFERRN